jgi:hypothetical protein
LNPSQTASAPIGLSPKPSEKEPSETAEISSQDELRILAKSYSNEKTDGIVIYRNSSGLCEKHAIKTPKNLQPGPGYLPKNLAV